MASFSSIITTTIISAITTTNSSIITSITIIITTTITTMTFLRTFRFRGRIGSSLRVSCINYGAEMASRRSVE